MREPTVCTPKHLPLSSHAAAVRRALEINPANAVQRRSTWRTPVGRVGGRARLAILVGRRWPAAGVRLTVSFLDGPSAELRKRIILHMNAWTKTANVGFTETKGKGQVRISRVASPPDMAGYWSYIGTEILHIHANEPTMNLESFTMTTPEREFHRVVRHETGHTLGFEHEHMRRALVAKIDREKAFKYFDRTEGWSRQEVEEQVLTPLEESSIMGTARSDAHSIMCYQIPGSITKNGKPIVGGKDIDAMDYAFAASMYPKTVKAKHARR
jgi:hypothetical protein